MGDIDNPVKRNRIIDNILLFAIKHLLNKELLITEHRFVMLATSLVCFGINRLKSVRRHINIQMLRVLQVVLIIQLYIIFINSVDKLRLYLTPVHPVFAVYILDDRACRRPYSIVIVNLAVLHRLH